MATQITTLTAGYILIQAGHGVPNHAAPKGSQFTDIDTAKLYFNKDGLSDWEENVDTANSGATISVNTFSSFSSSTIGQGSVIATTSSDNLTFSGVNLSILVDNTNQILTLSAATPSDYTFTGGTVNGLTNFTNGLTANTMSATTYYGDGSNLTGISAVATEFVVNCRNQSGSDMYRGQVVYMNGSTGNKPTILLAQANSEMTSARTFGVLKNDIANNGYGDVVTIGSITNLDTRTSATHPFTIDTLSDGQTIYLSPTNAGYITNVKPYAPNHLVYIGKVVRTSPTNGYIEYQIQNGYELDELHDVKITGVTYGDLLTYSAYNGSNVWVNSKTLNGSYTVTGDTSVGGQMKATTVSATTYYNLPTDVRVTGATYSSNTFTYRNNTGGTFNVLFNTMTGLTVNGNVVITGTTNIGSSNDGLTKLYVETNTLNTAIKGYGTSVGVLGSTTGIGYGVVGQGNGGYGVYGTTTSNTGGTSGVYGWSVGDTYTNIGVYGLASDDEVDTATNIGGFFYAAGQGLYNYSVKLNDGSEGLNKVLISKTADGKANWSSILSGLTGVYTNTLSATTYFNLPTDIKVTGGTYSNGSILFTNNTGGTFNVTGLYTGYTAPIDVTVTGGTYSSGTATFTNNTGGTFSVSGFKTDDIYTTGMTFNASNYNLSITRNDGTSFTQSLAVLASDMTITGGTYNANSGVATFTNNTGGTFNVSGFLTGMTDTYATGLTFSNNVLTLKQTNNQADLDILINNLSGLTVNGSLSATTFYGNGSNLTGLVTQDTVVTGGTYNSGSILFTNNTGGTFNVSGLYTGYTAPVDVFTTGATYSNNTFTYTNNTGGTYSVLFNTVTGLTVNGNLNVTGGTLIQGGLTANTISATTYYNLPTDIRVTGGTYINGTATFTNNTGGTFSVTGFSTGGTSSTDTFVTGATYSNNTFTYTNNTGGTFSTLFNTMTGLTSSGTISTSVMSATTYQNLPNAGVLVVPIATSSVAVGTGSNDYYLNFKIPYNLTISKVDFSVSSTGSDSVRIGIYRGQDLTAVLVGQSAGGGVSTLNSVSIVVESGQNLSFSGGSWIVIGVAVGGTTTNLYGSACPANNLIAWTNTTDSSGGFPTNPRSKAGTRTSFPSIELTVT